MTTQQEKRPGNPPVDPTQSQTGDKELRDVSPEQSDERNEQVEESNRRSRPGVSESPGRSDPQSQF